MYVIVLAAMEELWVTPPTYHDRLRDQLFPFIVLEIWTSQYVHMFSQLRLSWTVTKSTSRTGDYITTFVLMFACHHFSPPSLGHGVRCKIELLEMARVGSLVRETLVELGGA